MSDFDKNKDKIVMLIGSLDVTDKIQIQVSIRDYDNRGPKIVIMKVGKKKEGSEWFSTSLDRLNPEQALKLSLLMEAASRFLTKPVESTPQVRATKIIKRTRKPAQEPATT